MFDVLMKYNVAKGDPLGADYDEMAIDLVDGKTAFWFNGNWAWPNLEDADAEKDDAYGFLPYFMNNDPDDFVNRQIQASPSKQVMLDGAAAGRRQGVFELDRLQRDRPADAGEDLQHHPALPEQPL